MDRAMFLQLRDQGIEREKAWELITEVFISYLNSLLNYHVNHNLQEKKNPFFPL